MNDQVNLNSCVYSIFSIRGVSKNIDTDNSCDIKKKVIDLVAIILLIILQILHPYVTKLLQARISTSLHFQCDLLTDTKRELKVNKCKINLTDIIFDVIT